MHGPEDHKVLLVNERWEDHNRHPVSVMAFVVLLATCVLLRPGKWATPGADSGPAAEATHGSGRWSCWRTQLELNCDSAALSRLDKNVGQASLSMKGLMCSVILACFPKVSFWPGWAPR